jgi:hypothetical protein
MCKNMIKKIIENCIFVLFFTQFERKEVQCFQIFRSLLLIRVTILEKESEQMN